MSEFTKGWVGKRLLVNKRSSYGSISGDLHEVTIKEVSPSGVYVKMVNMNGTQFWEKAQNLVVVETLADKMNRSYGGKDHRDA